MDLFLSGWRDPGKRLRPVNHKRQWFNRAVKRILANPKSSKFNALEITGVTSKHVLGMPYVTVSARSRHIQESMLLLDPGTFESRAEQGSPLPESTLWSDRGK